ncbi:MAG: S24 family peptidase [Pseudomonadota bacterium]|nr:S24 family peptidase [Pseudomonadota bacterium]
MKPTLDIGPAIKRRRHAQQMTLQQLCDATGGAIYTSHLSSIERGQTNPSIATAYQIAKALGTGVETLIEESLPGATRHALSDVTRRVPVLAWESVCKWLQDPDMSKLPSGTPWVMPIDNPPGDTFALRIRDDAMQGPTGPAYPPGCVIFVKPTDEARNNEFVIGHTGNPEALTFKKLVRDGDVRYLRAMNPQYPVTQLDASFKVVGIVTGAAFRLRDGVLAEL